MGNAENPRLHPEHSESLPVSIPSVRLSAQPLLLREGQPQTDEVPRIRGSDDAVIPQPCCSVKRCRLLFNLVFEGGMLAWIPVKKYDAKWFCWGDQKRPTWKLETSLATTALSP